MPDGGERPYVLPILLFATNEPGTDVLVAPDGDRALRRSCRSPAIFGAKGQQTSPSAWLRRASDISAGVPTRMVASTARRRLTALRAVAARWGRGGVAVDRSVGLGAARVEPLGVRSQSAAATRRKVRRSAAAIRTKVPQPTILAAHAGDPVQGERRVQRMLERAARSVRRRDA